MLFFCIPVASILSLKEYWNYLFLFYPPNSPLFKCRYCSRFILMLQCPVQCPTPSRSSLNTFQTELKWVEKPQPVIRRELLQGGYHVSFIFTITRTVKPDILLITSSAFPYYSNISFYEMTTYTCAAPCSPCTRRLHTGSVHAARVGLPVATNYATIYAY